MTETKRKRVITIETWQRTVIRRSSCQTVWCEFCAAQVTSLAPEQAAVIFDISLRQIYQGIENGIFHFTDTGGGVFVCRNSIRTSK